MAAVALGRLKDASAAEAIIAALRTDESEQVRKAAAEALVAIGEPAVEPLMIHFALRSPPERFKVEAIDVLKRIGPPAAGPIARWVVETIDFTRPADLRRMVDALGTIGDANTVDALNKARKHYDKSVQAAAAAALRKIEAKPNVGT
jgi:HEAT repeat protein